MNGRYCGHVLELKRLDAMEGQLVIAPRELVGRLRQVFAESADGVLRELAEESVDLVEIHLPEVDIERLRGILRSERRPLEGLPGEG